MKRFCPLCLIVLNSVAAYAADTDTTTAQPQPIWSSTLGSGTPVSKLPSWLTLGGQARVRLESPVGIGYTPGAYDFYYTQRLRLDLSVRPTKWLRFFAQTQDTRAWGYDLAARPASLNDPLDLRQFYVEAGTTEGVGFRAKVGRQELSYAGGWVVSAADWGNTARVFDAAVGSMVRERYKLDVFAGSVVLADGGRIDRHKPGEHLYGVDWNGGKIVRNGSLEAFLMARTQVTATGELGSRGTSTMWLGGGRAVGKLPARFDYTVLGVREWGDCAADRISAWMGSAIAGWTIRSSGWKPRLSVEADFGSGDRNAKDGRKQGFDQLYGAFHYFLGAADRLGLRNSRNLRGGFDVTPSKKLHIYCDARDLALLTVADGLYNATAGRDALNTKAHSKHVGVEADLYFTYQVNAVTAIGAGFGHLVPGEYLKESTGRGAYTFPYLMVSRKF